MRRSDHPSRPSAITCSRFSALKTLAIPAAGAKPTAHVNVSAPGAALAGFQVSINGRFWVSTEAQPLAVASAATEGIRGRPRVRRRRGRSWVRAVEPRDEPVERSVRDRALAATEERNTALTSGKAGGYV